MSFTLDLIVLALVIIFTIKGYKNGFFKSILNLLGTIATIAISAILTQFSSEFVYNTFIRQCMINSIVKTLCGNLSGPHQLAQAILSGFPKFLVNLFSNSGNSINDLETILKTKTQNAAPLIADLFKPIVINLLNTVLFFIFMTLLFILLRFILKYCKLGKVPVIGKIDSILGAGLGLTKCLIVLVILFEVMYFLAPAISSNPIIFSESNLEQTLIVKHIINFSHNFLNYQMK